MTAQHAERQPRVAVLGGGTGIFAVLRGLRRFTPSLSAIVSMADNGGSSGRLRDEFGYLPPGDVRRCLVALAADDESLLLRELFEYRFDRGEGLNGHTFGNLLLTALTDILGSTDRAIDEAGKLLRINGRVLPVTLDDTTLCATLEDGHVIEGETDIDIRKVRHGIPIASVSLQPEARANPEALTALAEANLIVLGPGDLYTSVIPTLLVGGIAETIRQSPARVVYVCNVMTKRGETEGFPASRFIREINSYLGSSDALDTAILNYHTSIPEELRERYGHEGAEPVTLDLAACYDQVSNLVIRPLTSTGSLVRHDAAALGAVLMDLVAQSARPSSGPQVAAE